jgi:hypothetical protein
MIIKVISFATLLYVAFLFYYDIKTLVAMIKFAHKTRKQKSISKLTMFAAVTQVDIFRKSLLMFLLNFICICLLLIILIK